MDHFNVELYIKIIAISAPERFWQSVAQFLTRTIDLSTIGKRTTFENIVQFMLVHSIIAIARAPPARLIEDSNRKFASRKRPPFIAIHGQPQNGRELVRPLRGRRRGLAQSIREELMACIAHAAHVDLRFGDAERELLGSRVGTGPGDLTRKRLYLLRQCWNGTNGKAERMAKRVSRCASAAPGGLRAGASPRIRAVGRDLALARHAAFSPSAGGSSSTNSPSSMSCTLRRNVSPRTARRRSISRKAALRRVSAMAVRWSILSISSILSPSTL